MSNDKKIKKNIVIYQAKNGAIELRVDNYKETIWASQKELAEVFGVNVKTINEHILNVFKTKELNKISTIRKFRIVRKEGRRDVKREVMHYNLDMIISVGYRVNSKTATKFRQWATKTLKSYITKGYSINKKQIAKNYDDFMQTVSSIQNLLPVDTTFNPKVVLDLIKEFASTWVSLDAYDKEILTSIGSTKKEIKLSGVELVEAIMKLRNELIKKGEVSEIFAQEKSVGSVAGIVGNVMQSFSGKSLYKTLEEKAAHLLYFMVKDHPFTDGNKRSGAFAFIWFFKKS